MYVINSKVLTQVKGFSLVILLLFLVQESYSVDKNEANQKQFGCPVF